MNIMKVKIKNSYIILYIIYIKYTIIISLHKIHFSKIIFQTYVFIDHSENILKSFPLISIINTNSSDIFKTVTLFSSVLPNAFSEFELGTWILLTLIINCISAYYADKVYM